MAFFTQLPREPGLAELLGAGVARGLETGMARRSSLAEKLAIEEQKQEAQLQRGNSIANALLAMNGIEPVSNNPLDEPEGTTNYSEIAALSPDDLLKLEGIRAQKQSANLAQQKVALQDTKKFREKVKEGAESSRRLLKSVKNQKSILERGLKTGPLTWDALMFRMGLRGAASPQAQAFQANLLDYMEGQREKFGVRLTDADLRLILDKLPDIARTKKGNELILSLFESQAQYDILKKKSLQNSMKKGITLDLEDRYDEELNRLLEKNPNIEKGFENALDKLYERATGKKTKGIGKEELIGQEFEKIPPATDYPGAIIEDEKGIRYISNGSTWRRM